jgi:hypothetical protein
VNLLVDADVVGISIPEVAMAKQDKKLDKAVEKTFPASDPVTVGRPTSTEPAKRPVDRQPPVITKEQVEAAERGEGHAHRDAASSAEDQEARHQKDDLRESDYVQRELEEPVKKVVDDKLRDPFIATKKGEKEAEEELKKGVEPSAKE